MSKKDKGRLVPVKKHVVRTTEGGDITEAEITYYTKPKEPKVPDKPKKVEKEVTKPRMHVKEPGTAGESKISHEEHTTTAKKEPEEKTKVKLKAHEPERERKSLMEGINSYEDFEKIGVDPEVAKSFFCRL